MKKKTFEQFLKAEYEKSADKVEAIRKALTKNNLPPSVNLISMLNRAFNDATAVKRGIALYKKWKGIK